MFAGSNFSKYRQSLMCQVCRDRLGDRLDERLRVGMQGVVDDVVGTPYFDDAPKVHDGNPVGKIARRGEIVRNVE